MKILIIEDNEQIVDVLKRYLNKEEYETAVIHDGKEALPYFEKHSVDFVLLDIMLPNVDGFTICQQIREKSTVPIIMITAKSEDADRILGLEVGADDILSNLFHPRMSYLGSKQSYGAFILKKNRLSTNYLLVRSVYF